MTNKTNDDDKKAFEIWADENLTYGNVEREPRIYRLTKAAWLAALEYAKKTYQCPRCHVIPLKTEQELLKKDAEKGV